MSPNPNKNILQECADCGSSNTKWASINHGVLICDDCCLVHRSLGRCISMIKSITKSYWPQSLIDTIYELVRSNSNQIWEANLNSPDVQQIKQIPRKKPTHKDQINPTKTNYIKAKYENLYFITRGKYTSIEDLNQQLFNAVKTNNYELCLRILSQGADANYRTTEDSITCLHNAVLHSQLGQVELLVIFGADLTALDKHGNSPIDLAKNNNLTNIYDRLNELKFELTDDLSYFVCSKRPDHKSGQHFLIPDLNENGDQSELLKVTKNRLQELPDHLFEELCKDVYDEADRRQLEIIWKCSVGQNLVNEPIPFLIIKSCFSQTRNQLRQKLARFNTIEFSNLIIEILIESKQRYNSFLNSKKVPRKIKQLNDDSIDDDPLYDKVPSDGNDEDYASVASEPVSLNLNTSPYSLPQTLLRSSISVKTPINNGSNLNTPTSSLISSPNTYNSEFLMINQQQSSSKSQLNTKIISKEHKILEFKTNFEKINSLNSTPAKSNDVERKVVDDLQNENDLMKSMINSLMEENAQLRADKMLLSMNNNGFISNNNNTEDNNLLYSSVNKKSSSLKAIRASQNSPLKSFNLNFSKLTNEDGESQQLNIELKRNISNTSNNDSDYENQNGNNKNVTSNREVTHQQNSIKNHSNEHLNGGHVMNSVHLINRLMKKDGNQSPVSSLPNSTSPLNFKGEMKQIKLDSPTSPTPAVSMPTKETVIRRMKRITKIIQDLYKSIKEFKYESYKYHCERVNQSVTEMIQLFPLTLKSDELNDCLVSLTETCKKLLELIDKYNSQLLSLNDNQTNKHKSSGLSNSSSTSSALSSSSNGDGSSTNTETFIRNQVSSNIITYCYDIAFTVKKIVCIIGADS